jgi:hypothetical protein
MATTAPATANTATMIITIKVDLRIKLSSAIPIFAYYLKAGCRFSNRLTI